MWFWSVSWSTNCLVFFSFFLLDQKKIIQSQGIFVQSLVIFGWPNFFLVYQFFFGRQNLFLVNQKFPEIDQKFPETGQFVFGRPKKNEKKTGQLVDQETDQNHMDRTINVNPNGHSTQNTTLKIKTWTFLSNSFGSKCIK